MELAALYRAFDHFGWTDLTYTHLSARVPDESERYLIHPYGVLFDEITASNLVKVDFQGNAVSGNQPYSPVGHLIHVAVLRARPEIQFVLHSHTRAGVAVSALKDGLLPLSEQANVVLGTLASHEYGVVKDEGDECARLTEDLGDKYVMMLHNHGLLACGRTAGEAFLYHYFLQTACEIQVEVLSTGREWMVPPAEAIAELSEWGTPRSHPWGNKQWAAVMRMLERKDALFKT